MTTPDTGARRLQLKLWLAPPPPEPCCALPEQGRSQPRRPSADFSGLRPALDHADLAVGHKPGLERQTSIGHSIAQAILAHQGAQILGADTAEPSLAAPHHMAHRRFA